jgi:hypothetical protein
MSCLVYSAEVQTTRAVVAETAYKGLTFVCFVWDGILKNVELSAGSVELFDLACRQYAVVDADFV